MSELAAIHLHCDEGDAVIGFNRQWIRRHPFFDEHVALLLSMQEMSVSLQQLMESASRVESLAIHA